MESLERFYGDGQEIHSAAGRLELYGPDPVFRTGWKAASTLELIFLLYRRHTTFPAQGKASVLNKLCVFPGTEDALQGDVMLLFVEFQASRDRRVKASVPVISLL